MPNYSLFPGSHICSKEKAVTFVRATSFSKRVVNDWNHLPGSIVEAPSLNTFNNRLDEHWKHLWYLTTVGGRNSHSEDQSTSTAEIFKYTNIII